jgi:hypothetical protein
VKRGVAAMMLTAMLAAPVGARDWTPHMAAALLDDTFETAEACQSALDDARRRESHAHPDRKLNYSHLFEQGACRSFRHDGTLAWRIRMEWKAHQSLQ